MQSPSLYAFVGQQPNMQADPSGLCLGLNKTSCWETAKSVGGLIAGVGESAGKAALTLATAPVAIPIQQARRGISDARRELGALQSGGLRGIIAEDRAIRAEHAKEVEQTALALVPGVNTYRQASKIIQTYEQKGSFEGGQQLGRTVFSLASDATAVYGAAKAAQAVGAARTAASEAGAAEAAAAAPKLSPNAKGQLSSQWTADAAGARGDELIGREVDLTFDINGKQVSIRADALTQTPGEDVFVYVEGKYSPAAPFTPNQRIVVPELVRAGEAGLTAEVGARAGTLVRGQKIQVQFQGDIWTTEPNLYGH